MIKSRLYLILVAYIISINSCIGQSKLEESIIVSFVDNEIETPFQIGESNFEKCFGDDIMTFEIRDSLVVSSLLNEIKKLKTQKDIDTPDVRQKIQIKSNNNVVMVLCLDGEASLTRDGITMKFSKNLQDLINEEIRKYELRMKEK